jgi:hypothetical protein
LTMSLKSMPFNKGVMHPGPGAAVQLVFML